MFATDAVQIAVKYARVAGGAEEDQGVGERLKEGLYSSFEGLVGLGILGLLATLSQIRIASYQAKGLQIELEHS